MFVQHSFESRSKQFQRSSSTDPECCLGLLPQVMSAHILGPASSASHGDGVRTLTDELAQEDISASALSGPQCDSYRIQIHLYPLLDPT